jgi:preprotein translocase SecE subunit
MAKKKKKLEEKNIEKKEVKKKDSNKEKKDKGDSLFVRFRIFCHGVKTEFQKIHWPSRYDLIKYSLATIIFVIILSLFFYAITAIFELIVKTFV